MNDRGTVNLQPEDIFPLFAHLFTRSSIKELSQKLAPGKTRYWRIFTPLVTMWGMVYERLNKDHTCDAYVSHIHSGGVDGLDVQDQHNLPLAKRIKSEHNSAYVQARNRLALPLLREAMHQVSHYAQEIAGVAGQWLGHQVRLLDGTTFRLPPEGDLPAVYEHSHNQHGAGYWIQARTLLVCDWFTQAVTALAIGPYTVAETSLVAEIMAQEKEQGVVYVGDCNFGIYAVVQAVVANGQEAVLRLKKRQAIALLKRNSLPTALTRLTDMPLLWTRSAADQPFCQWSDTPIQGRFIFIQVQPKGFKPFEVYLFTTLMDTQKYATQAICELYQERWEIEVHFRHVKTSLEMESFAVRSNMLFLKELLAGLLAYNLIAVFITQAALNSHVRPNQLSFKQCARRIFSALTTGVPAFLTSSHQVLTWLLERLGRCRLPQQPTKVAHEPRKVRSKPRIYPTLKGERASARQSLLQIVELPSNS